GIVRGAVRLRPLCRLGGARDRAARRGSPDPPDERVHRTAGSHDPALNSVHCHETRAPASSGRRLSFCTGRIRMQARSDSVAMIFDMSVRLRRNLVMLVLSCLPALAAAGPEDGTWSQ